MSPLPRLKGAPLLGCLPELRNDRLGLLLRAYREGGDLVEVPVLGRRIYVVTEPTLAGAVLRQHAASFRKFFALSQYSRPVLGDGLVTSEGDVHRRQRRLIAPGLTRREVATYADAMARHTDRAAARWRRGAPLDVHAEMSELTLAIAVETMFGADASDYTAAVRDAVDAATHYIAHQVGALVRFPLSWPLPLHRRMRRAVGALDAVVYDIVRTRRASPPDAAPTRDILAMLLAARDEDDGGAMTDAQVRDEVMTLLVAGHETTANALTWALDLLARHPAVGNRLAAEATETLGGRPPTSDDLPRLPYALQVFKETMRLYPPAYMVGREALAPVTLGDHTIPQGATVLVSLYGLHRRPDLFPDPDRFDPDRFAPAAEQALPRGAYVPFADGPRVCIGNHFALMEGQIVLAHLAQRVRWHAPVGPPVPAMPRVTLRPSRPIHLVPEAR